ncbi:hypothetical protein SLS62_006001 [Diatrype stigma]|uniref:Cytochrome P450 alkane hydroxylase n=1 Tax=Diatrype stigma TaxID=117547 RepID=A0AAN9US35_9PEZI
MFALWFMRAARAHKRNEFLEYFNSFFDSRGTAECPDCVELQIRPRQRYILTRDPEHIKAVLTTKFASYGKGARFHDLWRPFLGDSIFTTDGPLWSDSRSLIRPMFVKDRVSDLATFERGVATLMSKLPPSGEMVDIMDLLYRMTLDVTTDFLLGANCNSLNNPQSEFASAFNEVQSIQMMLTMIGPFESLVPRHRYNRGIAVINRFVMPYIEQALALPQDELERKVSNDDDTDTDTFLHNLARHTRDPAVLRDQLVAVLLAGRDTTAATLSWTFFELCRHPEKLARLRREITAAVGGIGAQQQQQQQQAWRVPTYDDLKGMTYLRHVLSETLRLYPAVPYNLRAALEDTTLPPPSSPLLGGQQQPPISVVEGDVVIYSTLAMQRNADNYPPVSEVFADPAEFSPERWESWTPKPWHYVPFNGGPRICVGQNFALTEMAYCRTLRSHPIPLLEK